MKLIVPSDQLLLEIRGLLKKKRQIVESQKCKLSATISKLEIYLIYDVLIALNLGEVWRMRR